MQPALEEATEIKIKHLKHNRLYYVSYYAGSDFHWISDIGFWDGNLKIKASHLSASKRIKREGKRALKKRLEQIVIQMAHCVGWGTETVLFLLHQGRKRNDGEQQ